VAHCTFRRGTVHEWHADCRPKSIASYSYRYTSHSHAASSVPFSPYTFLFFILSSCSNYYFNVYLILTFSLLPIHHLPASRPFFTFLYFLFCMQIGFRCFSQFFQAEYIKVYHNLFPPHFSISCKLPFYDT
jgi:hypothetical protein